jgi:hypothetical protein
MKDLFGHNVPVDTQQGRRRFAHPAPPGTGSEGKTCKTCVHCQKIKYHDKTYYKCDDVVWSHCMATDIRLKDKACSHYQQKQDDDKYD